MNHEDEIVAEVRANREAYAARFNYDLDAMFADLRAKEREHPERIGSPTRQKPGPSATQVAVDLVDIGA